MSSESLYMDCKEVSEHFKVDERIIRDMAATKFLPGKQFGKVWRFSRERILKLLDKLPKSTLEKYEIESTLILWFRAKDKAPVGFCGTLNEKFRKILDDKIVYKYYLSHTITCHDPERSYRKPNLNRIVDNSARSTEGKRFDQQ